MTTGEISLINLLESLETCPSQSPPPGSPIEMVRMYQLRERLIKAMGCYGVLPDHLIRQLVKIEPFAEMEHRPGKISYGVTSYGYDTRLARKFRIFTNAWCGIVDPKQFDPRSFVEHEGDSCLIPPNSFVLAESFEFFEIPREVHAIVLGKSTYARCGIIVNVTPLEPEWCGKVTIEISNTTPLPARVYAEEGIAQVVFLHAASPCAISYKDKKGRYQGQQGITLPFVTK